jgi:hypothetical protein
MNNFVDTTQAKTHQNTAHPQSGQTQTIYIGIKIWCMQNLRYEIFNSIKAILQLAFFVLLAA